MNMSAQSTAVADPMRETRLKGEDSNKKAIATQCTNQETINSYLQS